MRHCRAEAPGSQAAVVATHGLNSWGAWASLLCSTCNLPGPGTEPMSSALAGGFLSTLPPEKSFIFFKCSVFSRFPEGAGEFNLVELFPLPERSLFVYLLIYWLYWAACRILVPWPGIEPRPQQQKHWVLTIASLRNSLKSLNVVCELIFLFVLYP